LRENAVALRANKLLLAPEPKFEEDSIDVSYVLKTGFGFLPTSWETHKTAQGGYYKERVDLPDYYSDYRFTVEIKPRVGDDYPAILRQVKRNGSQYLLIRTYTGIGATEDQFVKFFESQGIKVIFESDVDDVVLPDLDKEFNDVNVLSALNLLSALNKRGISLTTDGANVFFTPESSLTDVERDSIQELKREFLDLAPRELSIARCHTCGERITGSDGCSNCLEDKRCSNCGTRVDADGDCPVCPGGVPF
jgi:hypothetical protein